MRLESLYRSVERGVSKRRSEIESIKANTSTVDAIVGANTNPTALKLKLLEYLNAIMAQLQLSALSIVDPKAAAQQNGNPASLTAPLMALVEKVVSERRMAEANDCNKLFGCCCSCFSVCCALFCCDAMC